MFFTLLQAKKRGGFSRMRHATAINLVLFLVDCLSYNFCVSLIYYA